MDTSSSVPNTPWTLPEELEEDLVRRTAWDWALDVQRGPNWLFVRVGRGDVPVADLPPLANRLRSLLEQNLTNRIVLELDQARLPCRYLVRQLKRLERWIRDHNGVLRLCGLRARNADRLRRRGLSDRFVFYRDFEEAVFGSHRARSPR